MSDKVTLTEDELEDRLAHTHEAGQASAYQLVHTYLLREAGEHFKENKDDKANLVRDLANKIEGLKKASEARLQGHINKAMKR